MRFWLSVFEVHPDSGDTEQVTYGPVQRDALDSRIDEAITDMQADDDKPVLWRMEIVVAP